MNICIATFQNKMGSILKYRILDTSTGVVHDIHSRSIESFIQKDKVRNLSFLDNAIVCTEGSLKNYPIIHSDGKVKNNIPVIIEISNSTVIIANMEGKTVEIPTHTLLQKMKDFANADVIGSQLKIKHTNETIKEIKHTDKAMVSEIKHTSHKSALEEILASPDTTISLQNFNMVDYYKQFGVSDSVLKKPGEVFVLNKNKKVGIENNPDAYKFEIVKLDDRVELRSYMGTGYTGAVTIPNGVTHICKEAFVSAEATELFMPETIVYLGDHAFTHSKFKVIHLSHRVTAIPFGCFMDSQLEEINLENITSIDNMAFCRCKIKEVHLKAAIIQIGFEAFKDCTKLSIFEHNKTIVKIRHHAFEGCMNLTYFDFESVITIEQHAFSKTGIKRVKINGEVNYLQSDTFTGDIEEIELLDGMYKVAANAVSNINNKPIVWTVPKSVTNIDKGTFKSQDTVMCYRKSVAASSAILDEANIVYLDDLDRNSIPNIIKKANLLDASIEEILTNTLKSILEKDEYEAEYEIDESKLVRANIPDEILDIIGNNFRSGKYATDENIENEKVKFKCILEHLSKVAVMDITPFSSAVIKLKDTFNVQTKGSRLEELYNDGASYVYRITYVDNKYLSVNSSFIVAKTYDTLRYICMDNKYTNIMCENPEVQDLTGLLKILRPGDTIGLNSVVSGVKYPEIWYESDKEIEITKAGRKLKRKLKMNMYQALRYSSVTIKIDNNNIVLLIPGNKKIIKCASLGKTVWLNEREETYKSLQCTIESIEDIGSDTVFDYESTYKIGNYGSLLKRFKSMSESQYQNYVDLYSHIYKAEQSMYKHAGDYAFTHGMKTIDDVNMDFMIGLFKTSLFEERKEEWLEGSIGKTIVADAEHEFELSDGSTVYQYRTVKKTALRNKLMSGGDRKLYIFELVDNSGIRVGVYISLYDIVTLVNMCIEINNQSNVEDKKIFVDKTHFDIVDGADIIEISKLCRDSKLSVEKTECQFILAVYKPNGVYYIGVRIAYGKTFRFIPIIQIGELDVALEFVEDTNKFGLNSESMKYLYEGSLGAIEYYFNNKIGTQVSLRYSHSKYLGILKAREMCIDGISDITEYNKIGLKEILKRCLGYNDKTEDLYKIPELKLEFEEDTDEIEDGITDEDFDIYIQMT